MDEAPSPSPLFDFDSVPLRERHDGWSEQRQRAFIAALAESGCVTDACKAVGMSSQSAYRLRRDFEAHGFRIAWEAALDYAVHRLSDAAFSRAIHGVPVPHYYKGEVVGEHRRYDEKLTMFLMRYRDPMRYGKAWDKLPEPVAVSEEVFALRLARTLQNVGHEEGEAEAPPKRRRRRRRRRKRDAATPDVA
jgi:hypothetical protein